MDGPLTATASAVRSVAARSFAARNIAALSVFTAAFAAAAVAQDVKCPPDMQALERHAASLQNPAIRASLVTLIGQPLGERVRASGGVEAYRRALDKQLDELQHDPAVSGNFHDHQLILGLFRQMKEAAACIHDPGDPRQLVSRAQKKPPLAAIGVVQKMGGWGSAVLVGPCLALTSEHVLNLHGAIEAKTGDGAALFIGVGSVNHGFAEWVPAEIVALGGSSTTGRLADDWGLLRLDRTIGARYGFLELQPMSEPQKGLLLWALGFPGDGVAISGGFEKISSQRDCRLLATKGNEWLLTCIVTAGQSGGPLLVAGTDGVFKLAAITTAEARPVKPPTTFIERSQAGASVATATAAFAGAVKAARAAGCRGSSS